MSPPSDVLSPQSTQAEAPKLNVSIPVLSNVIDTNNLDLSDDDDCGIPVQQLESTTKKLLDDLNNSSI